VVDFGERGNVLPIIPSHVQINKKENDNYSLIVSHTPLEKNYLIKILASNNLNTLPQ
jgi:hypothetical protein